MYEARSKDLILRRVREALAKGSPALPPPPDLSAPVQPPLPTEPEELAVVFARQFQAAGGKFIFCGDDREFFDQFYALKQQRGLRTLHVWEPELQEYLQHGEISFTSSPDQFVADAPASLTTCEALVARTGSIVVSSATASGRRLSVYPEIHMVVAHVAQIVPEIRDALQLVRARYGKRQPSMVSLITGPSRTADIEKTLVLGAHGPRELVLFLIDDSHMSEELGNEE